MGFCSVDVPPSPKFHSRPVMAPVEVSVKTAIIGAQPLVGAAVFVVVQDYISSMTVNWMSFVGLIFVLVVLFFPRGILGMLQRGSVK